MARRSQDEIGRALERIQTLLGDHPEGLSRARLSEIFRERYGDRLPDRTLRRWLTHLVREGEVVAEGASRATTYRRAPARPADGKAAENAALTRELSTELDIPLSEQGIEVRRLIGRPLTRREPIGYVRAFLEAYVPGATWYLSADGRERLEEAGRTPGDDRPAGTYARDILDRLLIDLSWASSRLEGNTYSRLDTQNLIEFGRAAEGKDAAEAQMILNHKSAIQFLVENAEDLRFDRRTLSTLHAILAENLVADPSDEGAPRRRPVQVSGTTYTPSAIPQVLEECFDLLLEKAEAIADPFEKAFFVMVHLPYLQPFVDVNKRTSRLTANIPLLRHNLVPLSFVDVPPDIYLEALLGVYELNRIELLRDVFEWAYLRSSKRYRVIRESLGEPDPVRLRYREELGAVVREVVRGGRAPMQSTVARLGASLGIAGEDVEPFASAALAILLNLGEGSAGRYGLSAEELEVWRESTAEEA